MGFMSGLKAFTAAVLGGIGNIQGAVAGDLVLGLIEAQATQFLGGATWANVWAFILLIIVLVFRPQGPPRRKGGRPRMSTVTSTPEETTDERSTVRYGRFAGPLVLAGAALLIISAFLSWSYDPGPSAMSDPTWKPRPDAVLRHHPRRPGARVLVRGGPLRKIFTWFDTARHSSPSATARWSSPCS